METQKELIIRRCIVAAIVLGGMFGGWFFMWIWFALIGIVFLGFMFLVHKGDRD